MNRAIAPGVNVVDSITLPHSGLIKLDNGVPVHTINDGEQEVVKIEFMFKAGKWYEPHNLVADITNRMLREGTKTRTAKQIADTFEFYGCNFNTAAGFDTGGVSVYSLTKQAENVFPLLSEIFTESVFPKEEFNTIVRNRKQRLAVDLKKNDFIANRIFVSSLWGDNHPYGRITKESDLDGMTTDSLIQFYKTHYNAGNLVIIVAGKFDDKLIASLNKHFGGAKWLGEKPSGEINHPFTPSAQLVHHVEKEDSVQSTVMVGGISINKQHPDFLKLSVLNTVFGGYFGSRLMANIREDKGYTYGIYSSLASYPHGAFIEVSAEVGKEVRENTLTEIEHEINTLRSEPIDAEELAIVKNYMSGKILRSIDGPLKFSETLKNLIIYGQSTDYIHQLLKTIREVTAPELQELANKYYDYNKMYKVTVG